MEGLGVKEPGTYNRGANLPPLTSPSAVRRAFLGPLVYPQEATKEGSRGWYGNGDGAGNDWKKKKKIITIDSIDNYENSILLGRSLRNIYIITNYVSIVLIQVTVMRSKVHLHHELQRAS